MLPVFFALVGLRTDFSKILGGDLPMLTLAIIIASIAGKIFGALLAGVVSRISIKASLTLGVLMNTRGMIELVILNIGFDLGFIGAQPFASMIAMTIVTTLMTGLILPFLRSGFDAIEVVPGNEALSKA
jgi:Kef-type K+ transport system membrane component KefB